MLNKINKAVDYLKQYFDKQPLAAIILGTGLGNFDQEILIKHSIPYSEIPNFPISTVEGHNGNFLIGEINNMIIVLLQGRFHYYEGYSMEEIIFPIRVLKFIGISYLFITNASGGMNPVFEIGDIMVITDHINQMPNPLIGKHYPEFGPRFPDMSETYSKDLINQTKIIAKKNKIKLHEGCYVAVTGPTYETPKEYEYFRNIGGDNIGMSTVPEVIAAVQMGIQCLAISIITDLGIPGKIEKISHEEVINTAAAAGWKIALILKDLIKSLSV